MQKNIKYVFICLAMFLFHQCNNAEKEGNKFGLPAINVNVSNISAAIFSKSFKDLKYIKLENTELVGSVDKIIVKNDTIFIFDRTTKSVHVFNMEGRLLYFIKKIGKGPGEYITPRDFLVDFKEQTIEIYDASKRSILKYNISDGSFKSEINIRIWFTLFDKIDGETYILQTRKMYNNVDGKELNYDVLVVNNNGEVLEKFFPYDPKLKSNNMAMDLLKVFTKTNKEILISKMLYNEIYSYADKKMVPKYFVDYGNNDAVGRLKDKTTKELIKTFSEKSKFALMHTIYGETDEYLYFTFGYKQFIELPMYKPVNPCMAFYMKKAGNTLLLDKIINDIDGFEIVSPVGIYKDYLVSYVYSEQIHDNSAKISSPEMKRFLKETPKHSNPVIILFKLNK